MNENNNPSELVAQLQVMLSQGLKKNKNEIYERTNPKKYGKLWALYIGFQEFVEIEYNCWEDYYIYFEHNNNSN